MQLHQILLNPAGLNVRLFHVLNGWHTPVWDRLMIAATWLADKRIVGAAVALSTIVGLASWRRRGKTGDGTMLGAALALSYGVTSALVFVLKHFLSWSRPAQALPPGAVTVVVPPEDGFSFPSGHAALAMMLTVVLWPRLTPRARVVALGFTAWVMLSRVVLGAHFPADVAGGMVIGATSGWFVCRLLIRMGLSNADAGARQGKRSTTGKSEI